MMAAVVTFPGSNCDGDVRVALESVGAKVQMVWHREGSLPKCHLVVLPGGFSYGDYLRPGAMAAKSPIMGAVVEHARKGGLVLGICNGFQILTESGLLKGALLTNRDQRFICRRCHVRVERTNTPFTNLFVEGQVVQFPIAHRDGMFFLPQEDLDELEGSNRVVFRYCAPDGTPCEAPNGALNRIAGIISREGNVLGMMPHPERATLAEIGDSFGTTLWRSLERWIEEAGLI
jgi:phosphoribosylformylglycinamidine synthase